jgi:putative ABC transport system permease protein
VSVEAVTPGTFQLLGVSSALGRLFDESEVDRGVPILSTVVSEAFWRTEMGGSRDALGRLITLDGSRFQVVGVAAGGFRGVTGQPELWIPFAALRAIENDGMIDDPWNLHFRVLARLAPGVTLEAARAEVHRTSMLALFTAVVLVLLVATANLAGLMLARGANRQREASIRASLGAGGSRLLRQMLTESLTLAFVGGAVGVIVAWFGVDLIAANLGDALSTSSGRGLVYLDTASLTIDTRLLVFAFVLTGGVGVALGVLPAVQLARTNPISAIKGGEMTGGLLQRVQGGLGRNTMLVVQVTVALVLVVGASLMMRSMAALQRVDLGFRPDNLLTAVYGITPADEDAGLDPALLHVDFAERVRSLPGVTGVALGTVPMGGPSWATVIDGSDGDPEITPGQHVWMQLQPVDAGHLEVLGAQLVEGRDIEATDDWNTDRVIVINRSAALRLFPNGNPIGRRIRFGWSGYSNPGALVVGIAEDVQLTSPEAAVPLQAYLAVRQSPRLESGIMVRTSGDPEQLIPALRQALSEIAPTVALTSVMTMEERVSGLTAQSRIVTTVLGLFGAVSLLLVAVGLYGMIAFTVAHRTRELGLRASLGADRRELVSLVLRQGLFVTTIGIVIGVAISLYATRFLESLLFETVPVDPVALTSTIVVLFTISMAAVYVPARRAMKIDPMVALRTE